MASHTSARSSRTRQSCCPVQTLSAFPLPWSRFMVSFQSENPWRNGLAREAVEIRDGFARVPTKPGLGIEVDEAVVAKYAV